jgi:DNA repair protein RadD
MPLRYMQREAVDAIFGYWSDGGDGNCLVDMAGGSGKSLTMATLAKECVDGWGLRVLNCAHREELVDGNFKEYIGIDPFGDAGIYAASLGQRKSWTQVIFGQIQTIYNKADEICQVVRDDKGNIISSRPIDLLEIDEVHLVPELEMEITDGAISISDSETTQYGQLIRALLQINPDMKIVGFSATIYRTKSGRLDEGEGRMWDKCVYTYTLTQGIDDGYLAPLSSKGMAAKFDLTGVRTLGGDYKPSELQGAVDKAEITEAVVAEALSWSAGRNTTLWFCSGVDHALHVRDEIRRHGKTCETLTGTTPKGERRRIIADMKSGKLWGCTNDAVLTVGTNIPNIDMIVDMGPTKSCSRFVQKVVRGTRPVYPRGFNPDAPGVTSEDRRSAIATGPKPDCLYLDFAKNVEYHGSVDKAQPRVQGSGQGQAPIKQCPSDQTDINGKCGCDELIAISIMECPNCGYIFPPSEDEKLTRAPSLTPVLSTEKPWFPVTLRTFRHHPGKPDGKGGFKPDSIKCSYMVGLKSVNEWLCCAHVGFAKTKADRWWSMHGGQRPFPATVIEWLERAGELKDTAEIQLDYSGNPKYPEVMAHRVGERTAANDNAPVAANDNRMVDIEDCIPY